MIMLNRNFLGRQMVAVTRLCKSVYPWGHVSEIQSTKEMVAVLMIVKLVPDSTKQAC